ncbi:transcription termination factor NusA [Candidatus Roizmanbacteria bacterium CG22_combo_CG10-13_8_21_14_all_35_9]|uniref:Transcription termination/antitermination protein NusA n=4 Tax=Candidatus Roizmaniibacteriota TaxID=1752723 RepID=A0A2M8F1K1_9BACT|nr:MAG: transcription termination factor NusA [Candidatus Roizmanbacteria bacterium CG23_combo_of_CG06-09_8_20_14_all_35_49]PIP62230.1 MAG: transcription termination factor NusA [Candidatus Roizmanbacteria bacterium CG22_combo_CG10-13_8_21_14_all_35_9]PIY71300.1 MAG: transcription termination factor NusA [Candidatus Roizmanbacteria bacterium CG_4_10_14_0_8_um_filter_35_28]PJC33166.1 MAG: transcription termination factor NusA [Candidatus Roizmanbacteria bacterium CG_4_9_14_0_2_um_filter_35_15]PJ
MTIIKTEFSLALNQVATERGISPDDVIASIEAAIIAAYKREYIETNEQEITAKVNKETGETKIIKEGKNITPPGFGRIAAQTAKQVILQKIREAEKKTMASHYRSQIGSILRGRVIRFDGYNAYLDLGKAEAILPKEEQIKSERYEINTNSIVYLKEITEDKFGNPRIIVSRIDPRLIEELFKREVPEIANGTVKIKKVVREPGERAKIAVTSSQGGVDPVGACVGQKGIRVQTVTDELGGQEKIDIIQWNKEEKLFLIAALSPAKITNVEIDKDSHRAKVTVEEKEAPLAIGRGGINVNLASRLTEYEIDIVQIKSQEAETTNNVTSKDKIN